MVFNNQCYKTVHASKAIRTRLSTLARTGKA